MPFYGTFIETEINRDYDDDDDGDSDSDGDGDCGDSGDDDGLH